MGWQVPQPAPTPRLPLTTSSLGSRAGWVQMRQAHLIEKDIRNFTEEHNATFHVRTYRWSWLAHAMEIKIWRIVGRLKNTRGTISS